MLPENRDGVFIYWKYLTFLILLTAVCFFSFGQALEEAATNAAEEERRRLQTQTELQDRYRMDLEREKMVRHASSFSTETLRQNKWSKSILNATSTCWHTVGCFYFKGCELSTIF